RTGLSAKLSHYADRFLGGSHHFRFGVQYTTGGSEIVQGYNDYIYTYGPAPLYGLAAGPFETGGFNEGIGVYGDHTYRLGQRLSLNLGLRFDSNNAYYDPFRYFDRTGAPTGQQSEAVDSLFRWNSFSPRLGINYKLDKQGRTVLVAHYGRYYRGLITLEFAYASPPVPRAWDQPQARQTGPPRARRPLRPLLPRVDHSGVRLRLADRRSHVSVLGRVRRRRKPDRSDVAVGQQQPPDGPGLQEPVHRPVHRGRRAPPDERPRHQRPVRLEARPPRERLPGHHGAVGADHDRRRCGSCRHGRDDRCFEARQRSGRPRLRAHQPRRHVH